jgi:phosphoheptose isomerase
VLPASDVTAREIDARSSGPSASDPIAALVERRPDLRDCVGALEEAIDLVTRSIRSGGKLLVCGNGGSASDSEHLVADLMKGFVDARPLPVADRERLAAISGESAAELVKILQGAVPAIALGSNGALTTAVANDLSFDAVFAQQVYGLGRPGDVLLAISTTGNSRSVVFAAYVARLREMSVIVLTGRDGGELAQVADVAIRVPADRVYEVQELHLPVYHTLALALEQELFDLPVPLAT